MAYSKNNAVEIARGFLKEAVLRHRIRRAFLFGSFVWGRPTEHSDIDLAVVLETAPASDSAGFGEGFEIFHEAQKYNSALEVICFTFDEFESDDATLVRRIKKDGLEIPLTMEGAKLRTPDAEGAMALARRVSELVCRALGEEVVAVALYGSAARETARPGSDLDILVVLRDPPRSYSKRTRKLLPLLEQIRESKEYLALEASGSPLEPGFLVLSQDEAGAHPPIFLDLAHEAVILHDPSRFLEKELEAVRERMRALGSVRHHLPGGGWYWVLKPDQQPGEIVAL